MTICTLFFTFIIILVFGIGLMCYNIINVAYKDRTNVYDNDVFDDLKSNLLMHFVFGFICFIGGMGSLVTGIVWLVQKFAH